MTVLYADREQDKAMDRRRWWILLVLSGCLLMVAMDATILNVALPKLVNELNLSSLEQLWIVNAYALVLSGLLITMGAIGDRTGRRRVLCIGLVVFGTASLIPALWPNPAALIFARGMLGLGGAMIMPSTLSLIRNVFTDTRERTLALAIWATLATVGAAVGPVLGGFLVEKFHWNAAFLVNVPVVVVCVIGALALIPESFTPAAGGWDWWSVALSCLGLVALVQGIKMTGKQGLLGWQSLPMILLGVVLLTVFVRRQLRQRDPLLDVRLFGSRAFSVGVAVYMLGMFGMGAVMFLLTQWLQFVQGRSPLSAGLTLLPSPIAALTAAVLLPRVLDRIPARTIMAFGMALLGVALLVPALVPDPNSLVTGISLAAMGFGVSSALVSAAVVIMSFAPAERAGGAASIQETCYELGNVLGIAILGSATIGLYRRWLDLPDGLSPGTVDTAHESIGSAVGLPDAAVTAAARDSFTSAFSVTGAVTGVFMLAVAVVVYLLVPPVKAADAATH
ncbi:MFS transporter [Nocardia sp. NPDC056100]|uniref:MFS transporter n=1 Tax=Nocardia sp. NPDC056100 TaxID=3345712 RepID=UPI0035D62F07